MEIFAQQTLKYKLDPNDLTKYEIYELTKEGYIFKQKIDGYEPGELDALAIYPPKVDFDDYMNYRSMSIEEYEVKFPYLKLFFDPTFEDYFYYATRGWSPRYMLSLQPLIDRYNIYVNLSEISQNMLNLIYKSKIGFITATTKSIFEKYIISYDETMSKPDMVQTIGKNIGMFVPLFVDNAVIFAEKLIYILESDINDSTARKIINMSFENYVKTQKEKIMPNIDELILMYMDRLYYYVYKE